MRSLLTILLLICFLFGFAEQSVIDSLNKSLKSNIHDTLRVKALIGMAEQYYVSHPDTSIDLCLEAERLSEAVNFIPGLSAAYTWLAFLRDNQGKIELALGYYHKSLAMFEKSEDKFGTATVLNNIGMIYLKQDETDLALEHFNRSLKLQQEVSDKEGIAYSLNNMALIYKQGGNFEMGLEYYIKAMKIQEEIGDKRGVSYSLLNIGSIYRDQGDFEKGLDYYTKALIIKEEISDKRGMALALNNIGFLYSNAGRWREAKVYAIRLMEIAYDIGNPNLISRGASLLSGVAKNEGDFEKALHLYELHIKMRDSIKNDETQKATIRQQMKYEFEKQELVKEQEEKEAARIIAEETSRRDNLQYSVILIALLVIGGLLSVIGRFSIPIRVLEGLIFFSFLILFEFILVLADPYVDKWTGGAPGLKLLINAGVAALIFPLHAFFETKLKGKLVKK